MSLVAPVLMQMPPAAVDAMQGNSARPQPQMSSYPPDIVEQPGALRCNYVGFPVTEEASKQWPVPPSVTMELLSPEVGDVPVVDFSEKDHEPVRCSRCRGYINPYVTWKSDVASGNCLTWVCNLCGTPNNCPLWYLPRGSNGLVAGTSWRSDYREHPELSTAVVDIIPSMSYSKNAPPPPLTVFVIDVSQSAIQSGLTQAACDACLHAIEVLRDRPRASVGVVAFNSVIHCFYFGLDGDNGATQPRIASVPTVDQPFLPVNGGVVVPLATHYGQLQQVLEQLPTQFAGASLAHPQGTSALGPTDIPIESCFCSAAVVAAKAIMTQGGRIEMFASQIPSSGYGKLKRVMRFQSANSTMKVCAGSQERGLVGYNAPVAPRDEREQLQGTHGAQLGPRDDFYTDLAVDAQSKKVCFDIFCCPPVDPTAGSGQAQNMDLATLSSITQVTGGDLLYIPGFSSARDTNRLTAELEHLLTRVYVLEPSCRLRTPSGVGIKQFYGALKRYEADLIAFSNSDCDKSIAAELTILDSTLLENKHEVFFQGSLLYSTLDGQRRVRIANIRVPLLRRRDEFARATDLDTTVAFIAKRAAQQLLGYPATKSTDHVGCCLNNARFAIIKAAAGLVSQWRAAVMGAGGQQGGADENELSQFLATQQKLSLIYLHSLLRSDMLAPPSPAVTDDARAYSAYSFLTSTVTATHSLIYPRVFALDQFVQQRAADPSAPLTLPQAERLSLSLLPGGFYLVEDTNCLYLFVRTWNINGTMGHPQVPPDQQRAGSPQLQQLIYQCLLQRPQSTDQPQLQQVHRNMDGSPDLLSGASFVLNQQTPTGHAIFELGELISRSRHTALPLYVIVESNPSGTDTLVQHCMLEDESPNHQPGLAWLENLLGSPQRASSIASWEPK